MRLIYADKLIDALDDKILWTNQGWEDVTSVIYEQPTAFDVDKVIEELEYEMLGDTANDRFDRGFNSAIHMCIKIIKEAAQNDK